MKIKQQIRDILQKAEGNHVDIANAIFDLFDGKMPTELEIYEQLAGSEQYCQGQIDLWRWIKDRWHE